MKFDENKNLKECTEKELYDLWFGNRKVLQLSYDDYLAQTIKNGVNVTDRFIIICNT